MFKYFHVLYDKVALQLRRLYEHGTRNCEQRLIKTFLDTAIQNLDQIMNFL